MMFPPALSFGPMLSRRVEVDDTYLGGALEGGKKGRCSENKIPFVAAVQAKKQNNPVYGVFSSVKGFSQKEIKEWSRQKLVPSIPIVSDGLSCFTSVTEAGCLHEQNVVGKNRKSTMMECFTWVNTVLGNLKSAPSLASIMPSISRSSLADTSVNISIASTVASTSAKCSPA